MESLGWPCSHLTSVLRGDQDTDTHMDDHVRTEEELAMERAKEPALRHLDPGLWPQRPQRPVVLDHSSPRTRTRYTCGGVKPHDVRSSLVVHWLGFGAFTTKCPGSVPDLVTEIPQDLHNENHNKQPTLSGRMFRKPRVGSDSGSSHLDHAILWQQYLWGSSQGCRLLAEPEPVGTAC